MSLKTVDLPTDAQELRALALALQARLAEAEDQRQAAEQAQYDAEQREAETAVKLARAEAELRAAKASLQLTALEIEKFKIQLAKLRRMQFGQSSERLTAEIEQLELKLEELEEVEAEAVAITVAAGEEEPAERQKRKPKRKPLPAHLPRREEVHAAPDADGCSACGGTMSTLGEDVTEVLEYVPGRFEVVRHVRAKLACQCCDAITQAPAPALPIPRGMAGPGLIAHVLVSKYADHLPLYRQSGIYAREGVDLDRSTMADWVGQATWLLQPLVDHIMKHVLEAEKIHGDDTPVPVLAPGKGKTRTGRLWVYVRDDRPWQGGAPPAAMFFYSPDRKGEHPRQHLATFSGFLQADAYTGFDQLYAPNRQPGPITEVACWAHTRRKIFDIYKATGSVHARTGVRMIDEMYKWEAEARGHKLEERAERRKIVRVLAEGFFNWATGTMQIISGKGELAKAINYAVRQREALMRFCDDARLEADNNRAENCLRPVALGRKNYLFAGSDKGGQRAAAMYTLLETARLNRVDPEAWLRTVLDRIAKGHPINRIGDLTPWAMAEELALAAIGKPE